MIWLTDGLRLLVLLSVFQKSILEGGTLLTEYLDSEVSIIATRETITVRELVAGQ